MWPQQEGVDKLIDIIQKLQSHRETGQLTVIHGDGVSAEEGSVVFANGRVVETRVGRRSGSDALNRLSSWENCICRFVRSTNKPNEFGAYTLNRSLEIATNKSVSPPAYISSSRAQVDPREQNSSENRPGTPIPYGSAIPHPIVQLQVAINKIEQLGLSRAHRHLFLLIDGQRSISDLIRLIGKGEKDVHILLNDLARAAIISLYFSQNRH